LGGLNEVEELGFAASERAGVDEDFTMTGAVNAAVGGADTSGFEVVIR
jgi:hypothetical protein